MSTTKSVIISCAGIGSRLGLGQTKALIDIAGKSLIRWQLELLDSIKDIRIVVGYQSNDVIKEVLKIRKDAIFIYNHNYFETKTGASFYLGSKDANEYVIEWDGDLLVHPEDVKKCLQMDQEYIGYSDKVSDESVYVKTNNEGDVLSFSRENGDYEWTGPACIRKNKVKYTSGNVFNQLEEYLPMKGLKIRAQDIDTYDDYKKAIEFIKSWQKK
ncbi:MAG: NTP transferase domain-containing protein [Candidatus Shapirobacteria bacterium]|jgi:choline kinase